MPICTTLCRFIQDAMAGKFRAGGGRSMALSDAGNAKAKLKAKEKAGSEDSKLKSASAADDTPADIATALDAVAATESRAYTARLMSLVTGIVGHGLLTMLEAEEPPEVSLPRVIMLAHNCVTSLVDALTLSPVLEGDSPPSICAAFSQDKMLDQVRDAENVHSDDPIRPEESLVQKDMLQSSWEALLGALETILGSCSERVLVRSALRSYQSLANACGALSLVKPRDAFISSLCTFAMRDGATSTGGVQGAEVHARKLKEMATAAETDSITLSAKNVQALETLFNIAHCLGGIPYFVAYGARDV